jgi:hypothetical protein
LRNFVITFIVATGVLTSLAVLNPAGQIVGWAVGAGFVVLVGIWAYLMYSRAYTECTPAGIRTFGLGGLRSYPWPLVTDIRIRYGGYGIATVRVTTVGGNRFYLGAPVVGGVMGGNPQIFKDKFLQIQAYWRSVAPLNN